MVHPTYFWPAGGGPIASMALGYFRMAGLRFGRLGELTAVLTG